MEASICDSSTALTATTATMATIAMTATGVPAASIEDFVDMTAGMSYRPQPI